MFKSLLFLPLLIYSSIAFGQICDDFQAYSCDPNRPFLDGTNTHRTRGPEQITGEIRRLSSDILANLETETLTFLRKSDPSVFLHFHLWETAGLNNKAPFTNCIDSESRLRPNRPDCEQELARTLAAYIKEDLMYEIDRSVQITDSDRYMQIIDYTPIVRNFITSYRSRIEQRIATEDKVASIRTKFNKTRDAMIRKIQSLPISDANKQVMLTRLRSMNFNADSCETLGRKLFEPNAFYAGIPSNSVTYCPSKFLQMDSDFQIYQLLLHEVSHSVAACNLGFINPETTVLQPFNNNLPALRQQLDSFSSTPELTQCLRRSDSSGARACGIDSLNCDFGTDTAKELCRVRVASEKEKGPIKVCDLAQTQDQADESISDWFAAELLPELIEADHPQLTPEQWKAGLANASEQYCTTRFQSLAVNIRHQQESGMICESHPDDHIRVNSILMANPHIRNKLNCPQNSGPTYCSYGQPNPYTQNNGGSNARQANSSPANGSPSSSPPANRNTGTSQ
jgi:putative hemolysin